MKKITLILATLYFSLATYAQKDGNWCITDQITESAILKDPDYARGYSEAKNILKNISPQKSKNKSGVVYTIPVVVHVIYDSYLNNISREQIEDGIRVLNEDFRRLNADTGNTRAIFKPLAADIEIQFQLARRDPDGNCTDGITRTQSSLGINARDNVKSLVHWDNSRYFNIWVVSSIDPQGNNGTVLGYAYFPSTNQPYERDGMVIRNDRVGTIGTSQSLGRTISHEAGHYLGLPHPFGSRDNCSSEDGIADTPPVASANFGCNFNANSCHNDNPDLPDMIENHMDYADDDCVNMFTEGQKVVMRSAVESSQLRAKLVSASNLSITGVTNPPSCLPTALFALDRKVICAGENIDFREVSEGGNPSSWQWTFPGGSPSSSNQKNPTVSYPESGVYPVTLIVSNNAGSDTITSSREVYVKPSNPTVYAPNWAEDFELAAVSNDLIIIDDGDGMKFELSTEASSGTGSRSLKLDNYGSSVTGGRDQLISPAINTHLTTSLTLNFDYAFATKSPDNDSELSVYASNDCGETWILRRRYTGAQLTTAQNTSEPFIPGDEDWISKSINFSAFTGVTPLLIKFEFMHGSESNNLYIDNINFSGSIGLDEQRSHTLSIYPNPAKGRLSIISESMKLDQSVLEIKDLSGKNIHYEKLQVSGHQYELDLSSLNIPAGVYFLSISKNGTRGIEKLIIQ